MGSRSVVLVNLINGEVLCVNVGLQLGLERCADAAQAVPRYASEEGVLLDFVGATNATKTMISVTDQSTIVSNQLSSEST